MKSMEMKRRAHRCRTVLVAAGLFAVLGKLEQPAHAQASGYAANRYDPAEPGSDWYTTESLDLRGRAMPRLGAIADWSYAPLERRGRPVIQDAVALHVRAGLVLADRFRIGASLPLTVYQGGEDAFGAAPRTTFFSPAHGQAVGDLRFTGDVRLFGTYESKVRAATGFALYLPTGSRADFTSDGTVRVTPRLLVAGDLAAFVWAMKLGFALRPRDEPVAGGNGTAGGTEPDARGSEPFSAGHDLTYAVSAGLKVNDRFVVGPELSGAERVTGAAAWSGRGSYLELLLGGRVRLANDFQVGSAIGGGLTSTGDGAPTLRVLATFEYAPDVCIDKDGDGICAYEDACPDDDGVRTNDRKTNGCPADRDGDQIPDRVDQCPDTRGERTIDPMQVAIAWSRGSRCEGLVDTMRPPLTTLLQELRRLDGRSIALRSMIALTSVVVFVGAALYLADITDDVHPVRASSASAAILRTAALTPGVLVDPPMLAPPAKPTPVVVEVVADEAPPPPVKKPSPGKKRAKTKPNEIFVP